MCLIPTSKEVQTAEKDIIVYKMLEHDGQAPFRISKYTLGELKTVRHFTTSDGVVFKKGTISRFWEIGQGLHAFTTKEAALIAAEGNSWAGPSYVVKCVIPKGTPYVLGEYDNIVSLALQIGKAVAGAKGSAKARKEFNGQTS